MLLCSSFEKKVKPLTIAISELYSRKEGASIGRTQNKNQPFFSEMASGEHKLSDTFDFIKIL